MTLFVVVYGSQLQPINGYEQKVITDNLLNNSTSSVTIEFFNNVDKTAILLRSKNLHLDVRLSYVNVLPIFVDSDTSMFNSDNYFRGLHQIRQSYCRNPVPDALILNHRLLKDYKTKVGRYVCSRGQEHLCPDGVLPGEVFARRIPKPCNFQDYYSFDETKLYCENYIHLQKMFGVSRSKFKEGLIWDIIEDGCRMLQTACHTCKDEKCSGKEDTTQCRKQCDYICRKYREKHCARYSVSCSKGDMSEWSIKTQLDNNDLRKGFNCYLKRKTPTKIFEISYRVRIPNTTITGYWHRVTPRQIINGDRIKLGDFEVVYDKTTVVADNVILNGQKSSNGYSNEYNFKALLLKDIPKSTVNISREALRFMPLYPSLMRLNKWSDFSNCKLLSRWKKYFKLPQASKEEVEIEKVNNIGKGFAYRISQKSNPTKIKLSLGNGISVLQTLAKKALITTLNSTLGGNNSHWRIEVEANVTQCPAFIQLSVLEKTKMLLVLKQDILVLCPLSNFHVVAAIPKAQFHPLFKARLFIAYVFDGTHVYETRMEKRREVKVMDSFTPSEKQIKKQSEGVLNLKVLAKFDAITILTGCFVLGLIAIIIFSCIFRPSNKSKARKKGYRQAAYLLGRNDIVNEEAKDEEKLKCRQLLPIVFLVAIRVAYSFILTVSFITVLFNVVNKRDLEVLKDFDAFVKLKINQSNQIALALDLFRESEVRIMTDKAAFFECACDYHVGRIMRNMRDNMTALVQLHDLIAFDKVSEILLRSLINKFHMLRVIDGKIRHYQETIKNKIYEIEGRLIRYAYRVYHNGWFAAARWAFGAYKDWNAIDFLGHLGSFDTGLFRRIKARILSELKQVKSKLSLSNVIRRLKKPFYPLVNALLAPIRNMKRKVKQAVLDRINRLKNKILRKIPCLGDIDMNKWERHKDDFDDAHKKRCRLKAANTFVEKILDEARKKKGDGNEFIINSVRNDAALNILEGDATEEEYESRQESKLAVLKKVAAFYTQNDEVKTALKLLRKHSFMIIIVFDILLITYRNLKTYRFAFMMAAGYEITKEHQRAGDTYDPSGQGKHSSVGQKMVHMVTKPILFFFNTFTFILKLIFTSLVIPIVVFIAMAIAMFYLAISFTYNGLNVDTLDKLGAFKLLSSRLDVDFNLTSESLKEQAAYLNKFDLGMYKESFRVQSEEIRNTAKEFNADEIIRIKRVQAELCDIDKELGCTIDFRNLMQKLEMNVQPCAFPVIKARMPDNVYDSEAYRRQLKYELKRYVDALRYVIIRTFYIILGIIGTIIFAIIMSKVIFKFLKFMGMIRIRNKHIYYEIPNDIKERFDKKL